ncbi:MAG TPA: acyclic terpene utilization AtuA family protein [Caulobacteraceae bacterium]|nr:acyclic terpene utilization AtuA family protein [Caulobacteraceae bacterium]
MTRDAPFVAVRRPLAWPGSPADLVRSREPFTPVRVFVPAGALGSGVRADEVELALKAGFDAIALDAGSTDSGPAYLASGVSKYSREAVRRDLALLMEAGRRAGVPLLVGSCGTSGCDPALDWTVDIALEIAGDQGARPRIVVLRSEQDPEAIKARLADGMISPLAPSGPLTEAEVDACDHIVGLLGPEPYMAAVAAGADIVLGGRTTDTAVLAAVPLMLGAGVGPAWHAAKIAECGGLCTTHPTSPGVLITVGRESFTVEPLDARAACTPYTVSAHMLYENSDPFRLVEPGGVLDVTDADYRALDARRVEVTGSRFEPRPYTLKLEGAGGGPFQTLMLVGIEDPEVMADIDAFVARMHAALIKRTSRVLALEREAFDISLRPYGWNAVSGRPVPPDAPAPREIGLLFVATAATQALATQVAKVCNPFFFHFPVREGKEMPSYAFPFSPAEIERGQVFEFRLHHVVRVTSPFELVRGEMLTADAEAEAAHA